MVSRTEWEIRYMRQMGDTVFLDDIPDERRLARIEQSIEQKLELMESLIKVVRNLQQLKRDYVPRTREE